MERIEVVQEKRKDNLLLKVALKPSELTLIRLALKYLKDYDEDALSHFKESHIMLDSFRKQLNDINALLKTLK